jgi:hypothetical protein
MDVGRRAGPDRAEEDAPSEALEAGIREREEKKETGDLLQERDLVRNEGSCTIFVLGTGQGGG